MPAPTQAPDNSGKTVSQLFTQVEAYFKQSRREFSSSQMRASHNTLIQMRDLVTDLINAEKGALGDNSRAPYLQLEPIYSPTDPRTARRIYEGMIKTKKPVHEEIRDDVKELLKILKEKSGSPESDEAANTFQSPLDGERVVRRLDGMSS
eukprot:g243.t1